MLNLAYSSLQELVFHISSQLLIKWYRFGSLDIYTRDIGKHYKLGLPAHLWELIDKHLYHTSECNFIKPNKKC